jgi:hypothetical protein
MALQEHFSTLVSDFETLYQTRETKTKLDAIHKKEMEEVLDNLGYIHLTEVNDRFEATLPEIRAGIQTFRKEYAESHEAFSAIVSIPENKGDLLTEEELEFLNRITSLEGDFKLHLYSLEEIGKNKLLSRILKWRLSVLSLAKQDQQPGLPGNILEPLEKLQQWGNFSNIEEVIEALGDMDELSFQLASRDTYPNSSYNQIAYFRTESGRLHLEDDTRWFMSRFDLFAPAKEPFNKTSRKPGLMDEVMDDELNHLMIRLFQLKLWTYGTYDGKLDNQIGKVSIEAIESLKEYLAQNFPFPGYDIKNLIMHVTGDYYAIHSGYMFRHFFPKLKKEMEKGEEKEHETLSEKIGAMIRDFTPEDKELVLSEIETQIKKDMIQEKKRKRKIKNRQSKGMLRSIGRFFRRMGELIAEGVGAVVKALKQFFQWFKNGAKILLRELKKIYNMIREALGFFFSTRIVNTAEISSDFDSNFDCKVFVSNWKTNHVDIHIERNRELTKALNDASDFLGTVISYAIKLAKGLYGWIQLGIMLIRYLADQNFAYNRLSYAGFK